MKNTINTKYYQYITLSFGNFTNTKYFLLKILSNVNYDN